MDTPFTSQIQMHIGLYFRDQIRVLYNGIE